MLLDEKSSNLTGSSTLPVGFLRRSDVLERLRVSKTTLYDGIKDGLYPAPVDISFARKGRLMAWLSSDIDALVSNLATMDRRGV